MFINNVSATESIKVHHQPSIIFQNDVTQQKPTETAEELFAYMLHNDETFGTWKKQRLCVTFNGLQIHTEKRKKILLK